jgi:thioredoxin 1
MEVYSARSADELTDWFNAHTQSGASQILMIDFYADWCAPCRQLMQKIVQDTAFHGIKLLKINIDEADALANRLEVSTIPTIFVGTTLENMERFVGNRFSEIKQKILEFRNENK